MPENHILYYIDDNDDIIGHIYGEINSNNDDGEINSNNVNIVDVKIRNKYLSTGRGIELLNEYINTILKKYKNINAFELFNAGGIRSCNFYKKVFLKLGFKNYDANNNELFINCEENHSIVMKFKKISS